MKLYKLALHKAYFDTGYALMSIPKYIVILLGVGDTIITSGDNKITLLLGGFAFALLCYFAGLIQFKSGFQKATIEVQNKYNAFVDEVRNSKIFK